MLSPSDLNKLAAFIWQPDVADHFQDIVSDSKNKIAMSGAIPFGMVAKQSGWCVGAARLMKIGHRIKEQTRKYPHRYNQGEEQRVQAVLDNIAASQKEAGC